MLITDAQVGMLIESVKGRDCIHPFYGTITGVTVNPMGEPTLKIHMTVRRFLDDDGMRSLGYTPIHEHSNDFWEREGPMHPGNVQPLGYLGSYETL